MGLIIAPPALEACPVDLRYTALWSGFERVPSAGNEAPTRGETPNDCEPCEGRMALPLW